MRRDELKQKALEQFTDYFVKNYPGPDTIIYDPKWHAPKIFNAAFHAISAALSIEQTQPTKVKALEWSGDNICYAFDDITRMAYSISFEEGKYWANWDVTLPPFLELEAARAAAQQNYETRIRSALVNAQADADVVEIPTEPTDAMIEAGEEEIASRRSLGCRVYASDVWAAMVASRRPAEVGSATTSTGAGGGE